MARQRLLASVAFASSEPTPREIFEKMNLPMILRPKFDFLVYARTREKFFETITSWHIYTEDELELIRKAYDVAEREFNGIYRMSGEPYFEHLRRCALILVLYMGIRNINMIVAMILHDLIETKRTLWSHDRVAAVFNAEVAELVLALTKRARGKRYPSKHAVNLEYFSWLANEHVDYRVILLKAVDRLDNLLTLWPKSKRKIKHTLGETEHYLMPVFSRRGILVFELTLVIRHIRAALHHS